MYKCSECAHDIGAMLDSRGVPRMFICHRTGNAAMQVPLRLPARKVPKPNREFIDEARGLRAKKRER
ncbi:hypothetical protein HWB51_gp107 [Mycobacterium phage Cuke]|uniref:Uncharacterized protein n=1 Tax=Mycobacterium phage Cuke TaxID=2079417 RepID=A0A2L1IX19_9CAUD|nr:hypothetical protein HWB51_gp107 [Mycobacterium phage Cuke]AVD99705.1 hypothetical protein SEA_CUKE_89 [Mycobacterium phage Cuke]